MKFALKDYEALKKGFKSTVDTLTTHYDVKSIDLLHEPRKSETQFLAALIEQLDSEVKEKTRTPASAAMSLFAAMQTIETDANDPGGRLVTGLKVTMGTDKNKPAAYQTAEYYHELNECLKFIYLDRDASKGINPDNKLKVIPVKRLKDLITLSYKGEEKAVTEANSKLAIKGLSSADFTTIKLPTSTNEDSNEARLKTLTEGLYKLGIKEAAKKSVGNPELLTGTRGYQYKILNLVKDSFENCVLDKKSTLTDHQKADVLSGVMFIIRGQIAIADGSKPLSTKKSTSETHTGLTELLNAKDASPKTIEELVTIALSYLRQVAVEAAGTTAGIDMDIMRIKHPFMVEGYSVVALFDIAETIIQTCHITALDACAKDVTTGAAAGGFFGYGASLVAAVTPKAFSTASTSSTTPAPAPAAEGPK